MKRWSFLICLLILCLALVGCGKEAPAAPPVDNGAISTPPAEQPKVEQPSPQPVTPPVEKPVPADPLPGEQVAPEVPEIIFGDYSGSFMDSSGTVVLLRVESNLPHIESLPQIHTYYQTLWEDLKAIYELNRTDAAQYQAECLRMGQEFVRWTAEIQFEVLRNDGVTLSVLREIYENLGGAHPMVTYQAETFDVASQGRLLLGNLFTVSEDVYSPRLRDMILSQMDKQETENGVAYYDSAREQLMTLLDPMDFALTEDCLLIFYNEYALAPHAAGPQLFYLPLSELSDILLPQYITE